MKLNPANKRKHTIIMVGSGLAGASARRRDLANWGTVLLLSRQPRGEHTDMEPPRVASTQPRIIVMMVTVSACFYDTVKGGDFCSRTCTGWSTECEHH